MIRASHWWWFVRSSATVRLAPVIVAAAVFVTMSNTQFLSPYWLDLSAKTTTSTLVLCPALAATTAWDSGRWRGVSMTAARSSFQLFGWAMTTAAAVTAVAVGVCLAFLLPKQTPQVGSPVVGLLLLPIAGTLGYAALGWVLGRLFYDLDATGLAFGLVWVWLAFSPTVQPFWLRNVSPNIGTSCCSIDQQLAPNALLGPALLSLGLLVAGALLAQWSFGRVAVSIAAAVLVGSAAVSMWLVRDLEADPVEARSGAQKCTSGEGTEFCSWPEHGDELAEAAARLEPAASAMREVGIDVPTRLREGVPTGADGVQFSLEGARAADWTSSLALSPLADLPPSCLESNGGYWPAGVLYDAVALWLLQTAGVDEESVADVDPTIAAEVQAIREGTGGEQAAWYAHTMSALRDCNEI